MHGFIFVQNGRIYHIDRDRRRENAFWARVHWVTYAPLAIRNAQLTDPFVKHKYTVFPGMRLPCRTSGYVLTSEKPALRLPQCVRVCGCSSYDRRTEARRALPCAGANQAQCT